jgi:hypothetical protein
MNDQENLVIAVSAKELNEFGCPHCGFQSGHVSISGGGSAVWNCGGEDCGKSCCVLSQGVTESTIGFDGFNPRLQDHPRRGTPRHGKPDKRPEGGGEFFRSRGIGVDNTPGCFVCGGGFDLRHNIAAFVVTKEAGERVVTMLEMGARLDYREQEPDRVQVKIGACNHHLPNLERLNELTRHDGIITSQRITEART